MQCNASDRIQPQGPIRKGTTSFSVHQGRLGAPASLNLEVDEKWMTSMGTNPKEEIEDAVPINQSTTDIYYLRLR